MLHKKGIRTRRDMRGRELYYTHFKEVSPLVLLRICIPNSLTNSSKIKILSGKKRKEDKYFSPLIFLTLRLLHLLVLYFLGHDDKML